MRIVVAPQEYKGTLSAAEAAATMAEAVRRVLPGAGVLVQPLADGGPGTVAVIVGAVGGSTRTTNATGPLGANVDAEWGLLDDGTAVIEMAAAAGLLLVDERGRDPRIATTYGVGELIRVALDAGCRRMIVGLGGSATNDGGAGMAQALGVRLLDAQGQELPPGGSALARLDRIDVSGIDARASDCEVLGATDVRNPLCGREGASIVYGPQKGASREVARELDEALRHYAEIIERDLGVSVAGVPGAGAAGGLGAGLIAFLGATIRPGIDVIAEALRLAERIRGADLVLTGEGRLDGQTAFGKTVAGVARIARAEGVPVIVVPGALGDGWESIQPLVAAVEPATGDGEPAMRLAVAVERALRGWRA
ncbi:MAG TPA: glycerate kinase [Dehalococcoidia bacterium]